VKPLVLIGASGHGKVVAEIAELVGYSAISFLDHAYPDKTMNGVWVVVGIPEDSLELSADNADVFVSIGNNATRDRLTTEFNLNNCPILCHPSSIISRYAEISGGTVFAAGSIVNAGSAIGRGVIVNTGASIDHDCILGDFVHVSPGARLSGNVKIGPRSWIGTGAVVREGIAIGADVIVGAGAAVVGDVDDGTTVLGVPAKPV